MRVDLNKVHAFIFTQDFASLNNIYKVTHVMSYSEILANDINVVSGLYKKVGKTAADWAIDVVNYTNDRFFKLEAMNELDDNIIYVPESIISLYPNPDIAEYNSIMILLDLGIFDNPTILAAIKNKIKDLILVESGIDTNPLLSVYDKQWMTTDAYKTLETNRENNKGTIVNLYSTNRRLTEDLAKANDRIAILEQIITSL